MKRSSNVISGYCTQLYGHSVGERHLILAQRKYSARSLFKLLKLLYEFCMNVIKWLIIDCSRFVLHRFPPNLEWLILETIICSIQIIAQYSSVHVPNQRNDDGKKHSIRKIIILINQLLIMKIIFVTWQKNLTDSDELSTMSIKWFIVCTLHNAHSIFIWIFHLTCILQRLTQIKLMIYLISSPQVDWTYC